MGCRSVLVIGGRQTCILTTRNQNNWTEFMGMGPIYEVENRALAKLEHALNTSNITRPGLVAAS